MTDFSPHFERGQEEEMHPALVGLDDDTIAVLAAMGRALDDYDRFAHLSDTGLASSLLRLQDAGWITLGIDAYDNPFIQLNVDAGQS